MEPVSTHASDAVVGTISQRDLDGTVTQRFEEIAERFADRQALAGHGRVWTYRDLNQRVNRVAHGIMSVSEPGQRCVAILGEHSPDVVIAALGAMKCGKVYLVLHPQEPISAQRDVLIDSSAALLVATGAAHALALQIAEGICPVRRLDDFDEQFPEYNPPQAGHNRDPVVIFYTSGTTGTPKGIVKSHRTLLHRAMLAGLYDRVASSDRQSMLTSCSFASSEADMFGSLLHGATLCVFDPVQESLSAFEQWIDQERVTLLHPPVLLFRRFLSTLRAGERFPSVRAVMLAGEVVLPGDIQQWRRLFNPACRMAHRFSSTETGILAVAMIEPGIDAASEIDLTGVPVAGKVLSLVDDSGRPVPTGETGQLIVTSEFIADGFWRQGKLTAGPLTLDPQEPARRVYRTGDLGRFLPDGRFQFLGRQDHQVKVRGYRVELREIEAALSRIPAVAEATVVARRHHDECQLVAFVAVKPGHAASESSLRQELRSRIAEWKVPSRIRFVDELPTTLTGKVDRQRLEMELAADDADRQECAGSLPVLVDLWRETLAYQAVHGSDRFLDVGGHSLGAMMLTSRVEAMFGVVVSPRQLLENISLDELCDLVTQGSSPSDLRTAGSEES